MTRWDSPLFTVPYDDKNPPFEAIWEAMVGSEASAKTVKPHQATVLVKSNSTPGIQALWTETFNRNRLWNLITCMS